MTGSQVETAAYYRERAHLMRELAAGSDAETAAMLVEAAKDFENIAQSVDGEGGLKKAMPEKMER